MVEDRGPQLRAIASTFVALAFVATALRVYVRTRMVKAFGYDDYWMVFAMLMFAWFVTHVLLGISKGTGRHLWDLDPVDAMMAFRHWYFCYISYCLAMTGVKISVGLLLLRITVSKLHRWIIYGVTATTVATGIVFLFVTMLQCMPIYYFWDKSGQGSCLDIEVIIGLTYMYGSVSAICDFTYGILPIFLIWDLKMQKRIKIALIPVLSMACIASSAVVVRMAYVKDFKSNDFLYKTVDIAIWSTTEQGLAITAGSLATLRPLFKAASQRLGFSTHTHGDTPAHNLYPSRGHARRESGFDMLTVKKDQISLHSRSTDEEIGHKRGASGQVKGGVIEKTTETTWTVERGTGSEESLRRKHSLEWR